MVLITWENASERKVEIQNAQNSITSKITSSPPDAYDSACRAGELCLGRVRGLLLHL